MAIDEEAGGDGQREAAALRHEEEFYEAQYRDALARATREAPPCEWCEAGAPERPRAVEPDEDGWYAPTCGDAGCVAAHEASLRPEPRPAAATSYRIQVRVGIPGEWRDVRPTGGAPYEYADRSDAEHMMRMCYPGEDVPRPGSDGPRARVVEVAS